jgi:carboxypeptidase Q
MKKCFFFVIISFICGSSIKAQQQQSDADALFIRNIYDKSLTEGLCYPWLKHLTTKIGNRLSGSPQYAAAVEYNRQMLDSLGVDSVWLQPCMVPHWERGARESARILNSGIVGTLELNVLALGGTVATATNGVSAEIVEVHSLDEVEKLGKKGISGKIVFYNRPLDPTRIQTGDAYGGGVDQRYNGPVKAAEYGAVGVLVRSMTTLLDDVPHTGSTAHQEGKMIPALGISTNHAELLSKLLKSEKIRVNIQTHCKWLPDVPAYSVIGEWRGTENPNEYIIIGGHLDSWDVGQGAHDDGTGCVQSMDVLNVLKRVGYKPKHTIRCVLFANEENGLRGGTKYAEEADRKKEIHIAAIESDGGGHTPRGFTMEAEETVFSKHFKAVSQWSNLLEPYDLSLKKGGSGADISPLRKQKLLLIGFKADSQRYFDLHHTNNDTFDKVNQRELELGTAAITSLVFLIDKYGLK